MNCEEFPVNCEEFPVIYCEKNPVNCEETLCISQLALYVYGKPTCTIGMDPWLKRKTTR